MSLTNPTDVITEQRLSEFYQQILPYLGGSAAAGFTPVGTIIAVFAETAPANYLACDGSTYNKADYPVLANHLLSLTYHSDYEVEGDDTKFKVPDLRGEFLRGTGTNSHGGLSGDGADVGVHQNPTQAMFIVENTYDNDTLSIWLTGKYEWKTGVFDKSVNGNIRKKITPEAHTSDENISYGSVRPTNTSVLFCIATKNIYMGGGGSTMNYSTDEQVVGTWIDNRPLYKRTFHLTDISIPSTGTYSSIDLTTDSTINLVERQAFIVYNNSRIPLPYESISNNAGTIYWWCDISQYQGNTRFLIINHNASTGTINDLYATIWYVKTTD